MAGRRRRQNAVDIWPGFVDALSSLLLVIIFVLLVFALAQFYLSQALTGREERIESLSGQLDALSEVLAMERQEKEALSINLIRQSAMLEQERSRADHFEKEAEEGAKAAQQLAKLQKDAEALLALKQALEQDLAKRDAALQESATEIAKDREQILRAEAEAALLNQRLAVLNDEISRLVVRLEASEAEAEAQKTQIIALGKRLNAALASKLEELTRYRSDFLGKMRKILGNRSNIRIEGDRFVVQSELLFASGSADLDEKGRAYLAPLARALKDVAREIPEDIPWVLRIDGHTDKAPIKSERFPSNWELSTARAVAVVKFLIAEGIEGRRLAVAGFGEYQPADPQETPEAFARNRRIEIRFDQAGNIAESPETGIRK